MIYGYCRVSSKKQLDGNGLEAQEKEIIEKYPNARIYKEQFTGKTKVRPLLQEILQLLNKCDLIVVNKLDRIARNTIEGIEIIQELFNRNISIHVLNIGLLENTNMGRFFITVMLAIAEMERQTIIERTAAGLEIAKENPNFKNGRPPKYTSSQLDWAIDMLRYKSYKQVEKNTGISKSTLIREMKKRGLKKEDLI
ncbi:MAG: recombinase family protein [Candidatus Hodarchaeota archaeon]